MNIEQLAEQTRLKSKSALFALIGLILSPLAVMAHAPVSPTDSVPFYAPFDYEQWRRDHPRPAGKRLANLNRGEPRTVRMIYFLPNDRPYHAAAVDTMKMRMRQAQDFFAREMEAHGYGNTIVRFEADAQGEPLVHRVDGKHPTRHYNDKYTVDKVLEEVDPVFDLGANVYYIAIDNGIPYIYRGEKGFGGVGGRRTKRGGFAMVSIGGSFGTVAHELGHAFGLQHDFRDDTYVMSYGSGSKRRLSACNAEFLAVHPYFNPNSPIDGRSSPTIEEITSSPIRISAGTTSIPVRIKARDPDGLHQAILFTEFEVKACRGLVGERDSVVEFNYDGFVPSKPGSDLNTFETQTLWIYVVDALGNIGWPDFIEIINPEFNKPIATFPLSSSKFVYSMVFSPDGRLLAVETSYEDGKVTLLDVSLGKSVANLPRGSGLVEAWDLSPDGRLLALEAPNGTIVLWDIQSNKQHVATAPAHQKDEEFPDFSVVSSLAFSPNGRLLASGGSDDLVKLWDVASGEHVATFPAPRYGGEISSLAFSSDGKLLAAYDGGTVELWDVASREHVATIKAHENGSRSMAFSPDGRLLATGGKRTIGLEETSGMLMLTSPSSLRSSLESLSILSEVKLWNVSTGKSIATLFGSAPVAFSPDGSLLATGSGYEDPYLDSRGGGNAVALWEVSTGEPIAILPPWDDIEYSIDHLAFSPDGKRLAEIGDGEFEARVVRLWDPFEWTRSSGQVITTDDEAIPQTLTKASGDGQQGQAGEPLAKPFVVSVLDQNDAAFAGAVVSFSVSAGGGTLSAATATTDANGRARTTLTLGNDAGTNTVTATVEGLEPVTFTATAITPHSLTKVSGDGQQGQAGEQLAKPFVVLVLDEDDAAIAGAVITFTVTGGGGTMSSTTATTNASGRAARTLTLGDEPGTNTVDVSVAGLDPVTFTATAVGEEPSFDLSDLFNQSGKRVALPDNTQLLQNAPNPFNSQTVVSYFLLEPGPVRLEVFALSGQRIAVLDHGLQQAGYHRLPWDGLDATGRAIASGTYLYRLVTDEVVLTRKLVLLR